MGTTDPIDRFERTFEGVDEDAKAPVDATRGVSYS